VIRLVQSIANRANNNLELLVATTPPWIFTDRNGPSKKKTTFFGTIKYLFLRVLFQSNKDVLPIIFDL
jgi:hypothetical protein